MQFNYDAYKAGMSIPNKKTREQEFMEKERILRMQSQLENEQLSSEEKLMRLMQKDPTQFQEFMSIKNMMTPYQQGMLGIQRGQLGVQAARVNADSTPEKLRIVDTLMKQGIPREEALDRAGLRPGKTKPSFNFD